MTKGFSGNTPHRNACIFASPCVADVNGIDSESGYASALLRHVAS